MSPQEKRAAVSLAGIFSTRMLGLFMILPVFAIYAEHLSGSTPMLIGLAIGIYGLTQAVFQIPFGLLSDRFGRKPMIYIGLIIFAIGSVVAALSDSIYGVILGRSIQGGGAIAAAVMALAADLTREEHRLKAMAILGASMGMSFSVALVMGPVLSGWIGVPGIFWTTSVLALVAMVLLKLWVPDPIESRFRRDAQPVPAQFKQVLGDGQLMRLNFGVFVLHLILTASFIAVPLSLRDEAGIGTEYHWAVYLGVMLGGIALMVPFIIVAEKRRRMKQVFLIGITLLMLGLWGLDLLRHSAWGIIAALLVFFTAFNLLEASLPSLVAKMAPPDKKGTAMGIYSSSQFLGAFCGGAFGGMIYGTIGAGGIFVFSALMAALWLFWAATMRNPRYLSTHMLKVGPVNEDEARHLEAQLAQVRGVAEAIVILEDGVAYLKVDNHALDKEALSRFSVVRGEMAVTST
ncbi:MAG: MFS transporter [Gammaproteobacteria bacterium]|nr:MFS transporter [Gammaproteobacteria bacterium]